MRERIKFSDIMNQLKNDEYTGVNRCRMCTALNLMIAFVGSLLLGFVSVLGAMIVLVGSILLIYYRGYLIPGTPMITKRLFPRMLRSTSTYRQKNEVSMDDGSMDTEDEKQYLSVNTVLKRSGVITQHEGKPALDPPFVKSWSEIARTLRESQQLQAAISEAFGSQYQLENDCELVDENGHHRVEWLSQTALIADAAAGSYLATELDQWTDFSFRERRELLNGIRILAEQCPVCEDRIVVDVDESCCQDMHVYTGRCPGCDVPVFSVDDFSKQSTM